MYKLYFSTMKFLITILLLIGGNSVDTVFQIILRAFSFIFYKQKKLNQKKNLATLHNFTKKIF